MKKEKLICFALLLLICAHSIAQNNSYSAPPISIFKNTMVDMNWTQVKEAAENDAVILMTTAVIEEHGPHMGNGVDTYLGYRACLNIKKELDAMNIPCLIAPPLYWGMNILGPSFPGSFYVRDSTMTMLLEDILTALNTWGFTRVFNVNAHGDGNHIVTGLRTFASAKDKIGIEARYLLSEADVQRMRLTGNEHFVCQYTSQEEDFEMSENADIHAGAFETAIVAGYYPEYVDMDLARSLKPTKISWQKLGEAFRDPGNHLPLGYVGDPAGFEQIDGKEYWDATCKQMAIAIRRMVER